jgi:hypothetical protein
MNGTRRRPGREARKVSAKYGPYPHRSVPTPLTAPARRPVKENSEDRNAY